LPMWHPPSRSTIPAGKAGESIRLGERIFNETPMYAAEHTGGTLSCDNCHAGHGTQPFASPMVGMPAAFPMYNARAGRRITLKDRIQECFVRSENGTPLDENGEQMKAVVDYITWLSQKVPETAPYVGRGLITLPALKPDPVHGAAIYAEHCAGCHGEHGEGRWPHPPLWGPGSFNDGAGMNGVPKMAAFVQQNMPANRKGLLTPQEAYDVSAFIHAQPRPVFNTAYAHF
jgi:thiosulfate dehydrogenase